MARKNDNLALQGSNIYQAQYVDQIDEDYVGNPFIEALPPALRSEEAIEMLTYLPRYISGERDLDAETRYSHVQRLFKYFEPLDRHLILEKKISAILRSGYTARNPLNPKEAARLQADYRIRKCGGYDIPDIGFETSATGLTIIGPSGIGKTTTINRILRYYPPVIMHSNYKEIKLSRMQVVWMKLDCPFDGSIKGLCINFFQAIDDLVKTDYYKRFGDPRKSVDYMLPRMKQIATLYGLGLLVIDEIQHLSTAKSGGSEKMLNFFVTLINTIGVPVILVGTPGALSILQEQFRQARRGSGQGDVVWDRLRNDEYWDLFIQGMWKYQWTQNEVILTPEMKDVLYYESQGIIDLVIKLYALAQWKAISTREEIITPECIREVVGENLKLVKPMLEALKSGNLMEISKYSDIRPIDISLSMANYYHNLHSNANQKVKTAKRDIEEKENIANEIISRLVGVGIEANTAKKAASKVLTDIKDFNDITTATALAHSIAAQSPKAGKKTRIQEPMESDDLRFIVKTGREQEKIAYHSLKEQAVIKSPIDEFFEVGNKSDA